MRHADVDATLCVRLFLQANTFNLYHLSTHKKQLFDNESITQFHRRRWSFLFPDTFMSHAHAPPTMCVFGISPPILKKVREKYWNWTSSIETGLENVGKVGMIKLLESGHVPDLLRVPEKAPQKKIGKVSETKLKRINSPKLPREKNRKSQKQPESAQTAPEKARNVRMIK